MAARYWLIVLLLGVTATVVYSRRDSRRVHAVLTLDHFPESLAGYRGADLPLDPRIPEIMGSGFFLNRIYTPEQPETLHSQVTHWGPIAVFISYFPTQQAGQSLRTPQIGLPGSGWFAESSDTFGLTDSSGRLHQVADTLITDGDREDEVLSWYQAHGRTLANDYQAKLFTIFEEIRFKRSDAALVRVVTPLQAGETREQARVRAAGFAASLNPTLASYIPD